MKELPIKRLSFKLRSTGFFHVFGSSAINKVISFASGIVLVRIISKAEYGVFSYANNILNFFILISGLGAVPGVLQMCSETKDDLKRSKIYAYGCRVSFLSDLGLSVLILLVALLIPLKIEGANLCLMAIAFLPGVMLVHEMQGTYLRTELRNKEYAVSNTFTTVSVFVLSCVLSWLFSVKGLIAAKYIAFILAIIFTAWRFKVYYPIKNQVHLERDTIKAFWGISGISMLNNGLSRLMYLLDIFVLGIVLPDSTLIASYQVATNIPTALAFIPAAIVIYIYPYFAKHKEDKKWVLKKYTQVTIALGFGCFVIAVVMVVFAPWIIRLVFGEAYLDAVPAFRILSVSFAVSSPFRTLAGNILVTQRRLKFNLFVAILSSAFNTVLNVLFIQEAGAVGAAYATLITAIISSILNVWYLIAILKTKKKTC